MLATISFLLTIFGLVNKAYNVISRTDQFLLTTTFFSPAIKALFPTTICCLLFYGEIVQYVLFTNLNGRANYTILENHAHIIIIDNKFSAMPFLQSTFSNNNLLSLPSPTHQIFPSCGENIPNHIMLSFPPM